MTRPPTETLRRLYDALADSVAELPNSEVLAEAREAGVDTAAVARDLRTTALDALRLSEREALDASERGSR